MRILAHAAHLGCDPIDEVLVATVFEMSSMMRMKCFRSNCPYRHDYRFRYTRIQWTCDNATSINLATAALHWLLPWQRTLRGVCAFGISNKTFLVVGGGNAIRGWADFEMGSYVYLIITKVVAHSQWHQLFLTATLKVLPKIRDSIGSKNMTQYSCKNYHRHLFIILYFFQRFLNCLLAKFAQWRILWHQYPKMKPE